jgi:hypothetical protein
MWQNQNRQIRITFMLVITLGILLGSYQNCGQPAQNTTTTPAKKTSSSVAATSTTSTTSTTGTTSTTSTSGTTTGGTTGSSTTSTTTWSTSTGSSTTGGGSGGCTLSGSWGILPLSNYPGDTPTDDMSGLPPGPITSYGGGLQWAQLYGHTDTYNPSPNSDGFLVVKNSDTLRFDSTDHCSGSGDAGCQRQHNPVWEIQGNASLVTSASLSGGSVFNPRLNLTASGTGGFAIRGRLLDNGQTFYTPVIKICIQ